jgi:autotransporter strand-loop-strand O-heptosyltransferase
MIYDNLKQNKNNIVEIKNKVIIYFVGGPFVEVQGNISADYTVEFIDNKSGKIYYSTTIKNNMWTKCSIEYFVEWKIRIYENGKLWYEYLYDAKDKRVYIAIDSKALGDSLAWFAYVDEFRKKHQCKVITSTFMNHMFIDQYPEITFVEPGTNVEGLYAMYKIGLFYNENSTVNLYKNPTDPKSVTLQKMCSDILGLSYKEIKPKIKNRNIKIEPTLKQVCIATFGTAQSKFWNNPTGWQDVVDWLNDRGYTVKLLSKEGDDYMGNKHPTGVIQHPNGPLELVIDEMKKSKAFIGIGSGLSWLSWALDVPTVLISGFSYDWAEMKDCVRINAADGKCKGCFNRLKLDAGDWYWCPDHKGTERQFECTKSITSQMVINELKKFL